MNHLWQDPDDPIPSDGTDSPPPADARDPWWTAPVGALLLALALVLAGMSCAALSEAWTSASMAVLAGAFRRPWLRARLAILEVREAQLACALDRRHGYSARLLDTADAQALLRLAQRQADVQARIRRTRRDLATG
jgi:hypothetical protein